MNTKLLRLLEQDCTLTPEQLASMADMTVEAVKAQMKEYEEEKIVLGYQAIVDWDRTDRESVTALIEVKVTPQRGAGFDRVAERIYQYDEVESVYLMSCLLYTSCPSRRRWAASAPGSGWRSRRWRKCRCRCSCGGTCGRRG